MVWQAVADREVAQAARVGRVAGADDPKADPQPDQDRAAHDQGPQDLIAEHQIVGDDLPQPLLRDDQHLAGLAHDRRDEHRLAGDQAELAEEPPRSVNADHSLAGARLLDDRDLPLEDHEEIAVAVALAVEHVPGLDASALADRLERGDLLIAQPRERPVDVGRLGQRQRLRRRHWRSVQCACFPGSGLRHRSAGSRRETG